MRDRWLAFILALATLSACSSGSMVPIALRQPHGDTSTKRVGDDALGSTGKARLEIRLTIPRRNRRAHYISPSTKSIVISKGKTKLGVFDTATTSKYCSPVSGSTVCIFALKIAPGKNQTFTIAAFDAPSGKGKELSTGSVTQSIVAGSANEIAIALGGVVASISIAVQRPNAAAGSPTSVGVTVMAKDADGNVIVGPDDYSSPIALTNSDTSKITALSATTVKSPATTVTLNYTGGSVTAASIGASAKNVPAANVTPGIFRPTPRVVGSFTLPTTFGADSNTSVSPRAITTAQDGNVWFSVADTAGNSGLMYMTTSGTITPIVPGTGVGTNLPNDPIYGLAPSPIGDKGVIYASANYIGGLDAAGDGGAQQLNSTNFPGLCSGAHAQRVITYGSGPSNGGAIITIQCGTGSQIVDINQSGPTVSSLPTGFINPKGLLIGKDGKLYVAGEDGNTNKAAIVQGSIVGGSIDTNPSLVLDVANAGASFTGLAQDGSGDLWATTNGCAQSYLVKVSIGASFGASSSTLVPTLAGCSYPAFLTALADGSLWVPENGQNEITQVIPGANGAPPQLYDFAVPTPYAIYGDIYDVTVGPDGDLYFTNYDGSTAGAFSSNVVKVAY